MRRMMYICESDSKAFQILAAQNRRKLRCGLEISGKSGHTKNDLTSLVEKGKSTLENMGICGIIPCKGRAACGLPEKRKICKARSLCSI